MRNHKSCKFLCAEISLAFFYASLMRNFAHVYVSASRKLRLQCGSLLSLLALLSAASSPPPPSSSSSSFLLWATYYLPVGRLSFLLGARREVVTLGSNDFYLGDGNGEDYLFPLVWRGWQFRGVSHRGAASRTSKSLERDDERQKKAEEKRRGREGGRERAILFW